MYRVLIYWFEVGVDGWDLVFGVVSDMERECILSSFGARDGKWMYYDAKVSPDYRQKSVQVRLSKSPTHGVGQKSVQVFIETTVKKMSKSMCASLPPQKKVSNCDTSGWRLVRIDLDIFFTVVSMNGQVFT